MKGVIFFVCSTPWIFFVFSQPFSFNWIGEHIVEEDSRKKDRYMWQMKRAMYGGDEHRVSSRNTWREFSEKQDMQHSRYVTKSLTVLRWIRWLQSTADDIIAEGEPEEIGSFGWGIEAMVGSKYLTELDQEQQNMDSTWRDTSCTSTVRDSSGWKIRSILLRSSETVPRWARSHRVPPGSKT